jgi:CheY-like chemotaxis protein
LLDGMAEGLLALDATLRVSYANRAIENVLDVKSEDLLGRDLFSAVSSLRASAEADVREALSQGTGRRVDGMHVCGDRCFELRISPLPDGGLVLLFVDVTDRAEVDRWRGDELARLAHDLRNPLTPLRTSLELLKRPTIAEETKQRARDIMGRQLIQMVSLIDELDEIARATGATGNAKANGEQSVDATGPGDTVIADDANESTAQSRAATDRGARVLVADDSALIQESVLALLRAEGYEVRTVSDGIEAIAAAAEWKPRYVLLDLHMPRLGGMEAAKQLRQDHPVGGMVLVMMSGVALDDSWREHALAAGFDACLDKTSDPMEWLSAIRRAGAKAH